MVDKNLQIGQTVYSINKYYFAWSTMLVEGIVISECTPSKDGDYYQIKNLKFHMSYNMPCEDIFISKDEALAEIDRRVNQTKMEYSKEIQSVEDLVRFMYNHFAQNIDDCKDNDAVEVACEKAKELLNITLQEDKLSDKDQEDIER